MRFEIEPDDLVLILDAIGLKTEALLDLARLAPKGPETEYCFKKICQYDMLVSMLIEQLTTEEHGIDFRS